MGNRLALPVAEMAGRYAAGESTYGLGRAYGASCETVRERLHGAGVKMRPRGWQLGNRNRRKRGGPLDESSYGYLCTSDREGKRCRVHRACWEAYFGPIPSGHIIHHIDEDRQNNEIENLVCMPHGEHTRQHRNKSSRNARG